MWKRRMSWAESQRWEAKRRRGSIEWRRPRRALSRRRGSQNPTKGGKVSSNVLHFFLSQSPEGSEKLWVFAHLIDVCLCSSIYVPPIRCNKAGGGEMTGRATREESKQQRRPTAIFIHPHPQGQSWATQKLGSPSAPFHCSSLSPLITHTDRSLAQTVYRDTCPLAGHWPPTPA